MFLIAKREGSAAHIWNGEDTLCRMWSTSFIYYPDNYEITPDRGERRICQNCQAVERQPFMGRLPEA